MPLEPDRQEDPYEQGLKDRSDKSADKSADTSAEEQDGQIGRILARTYRLERLLVAGGMGAVYLGRHLRTGGLCAVKVLHRHSAERAELFERFRDEARISCLLRHPNIVQVTDLDQDEGGMPFLVMELLLGEDLGERLDREPRLPLDQVLTLARQVGSALYAAHCQGVVHRDLKPQNIFLARAESSGQMLEKAKLLDFGLSKIPRPADRVTRDLLVLGTPRYLAPEAAQGQNSQLDGRADQFSLAVILYRALCGQLPFDGEDVAEVLHAVVYSEPRPLLLQVPWLPLPVARAIERALSKRKEDRFDTILDFVKALTEGQKDLGLPLPLTSAFVDVGNGRRAAGPESNVPQAWTATALLSPATMLAPAVESPFLPLAAPGPPGERALSPWRLGIGALLGALCALPLVILVSRGPDSAPVQRGRVTEAERRQAAMQRREQAEREKAAQAIYQRFTQAADRNDMGAALKAYALLPPDSAYRQTARAQQAPLFALFVRVHLEKAQDLREQGRCDEFIDQVQKVLDLLPDEPSALSWQWQECPRTRSSEGHVPARVAYPPLRLSAGDTGHPSAPEPHAPDRALAEAQGRYQQGRYQQAIEAAHLLAGQDGPLLQQAYRLIGASACALHRLQLFGEAYRQLDLPTRELVLKDCQGWR